MKACRLAVRLKPDITYRSCNVRLMHFDFLTAMKPSLFSLMLSANSQMNLLLPE